MIGDGTGAPSSKLAFDRQAFVDTFNVAPMRLARNLVDHPLLTIDRLAQLADSLEPRNVEHNFGDIPDVIAPEELLRLDVTPGEVVRGIADNGCWIGLRNVHTDPEYKALLEETLSEVTDLVDEGPVTKMEGASSSSPRPTQPRRRTSILSTTSCCT